VSTETRLARTVGGENPFGVAPTGDLLQTPQPAVPDWGETMYFGIWNSDESVGIWIHTGRCPEDVGLWWAQTVAMLPDGVLLMDRSWGRPRDERGPSTDNLQVVCEEPLQAWRLGYDGAGEHTTTEQAARGPVGAGPCLPFRFDVRLRAIAPVWDMDRALGIEDLSWAHVHHEQALRSTGELIACGRTYSLDGVCFRDHSAGPRDVTNLGGDQFFNAISPETGRVAHGLINWKQDGAVDHRTFATYSDGRYALFAEGEMTGIEDPVKHSPREIVIRIGGGEESTVLTGQVQHGFTVSLIEPNVNINGAALFHPDPLILTESFVRYMWPDGDVGYGKLERDYRLRMIPSVAPR
jgi:hypothetical protein